MIIFRANNIYTCIFQAKKGCLKMIEKLFEETIPYSNLFYLYTIFSLTYPTSSLSYP